MRISNRTAELLKATYRSGTLTRILQARRLLVAQGQPVVLTLMLLPALALAQRPVNPPVVPTESSIQGKVAVASPDGRLTILPGVTLSLTAISSQISAAATHGDIENHVRVEQQHKVPPVSALTALTDAQGHYAFSRLRPGTYQLQAAPASFQAFSETIVLAPGELHVAKIELRLASVTQTVNVRGQAPGVAQKGASVPARFHKSSSMTFRWLSRNSLMRCHSSRA